jgi:hypothetical protein
MHGGRNRPTPVADRLSGVRAGLVVAGLLAASAHPLPCLADDVATSKSLSFATYKEEVGRVTVIVGSQLTGNYAESRYAPLQIAVGVYGEGPALVISPASFSLIDAAGTVYPMAPYPDVRDAEIILFVKQLDKTIPLVTGDAFLDRVRVSSIFYPQSAAPAGKERVELTDRTYFKDLIYFPRPENGWDGVLTLQFMARGLERPVQVRFSVPGLRRQPDGD